MSTIFKNGQIFQTNKWEGDVNGLAGSFLAVQNVLTISFQSRSKGAQFGFYSACNRWTPKMQDHCTVDIFITMYDLDERAWHINHVSPLYLYPDENLTWDCLPFSYRHDSARNRTWTPRVTRGTPKLHEDIMHRMLKCKWRNAFFREINVSSASYNTFHKHSVNWIIRFLHMQYSDKKCHNFRRNLCPKFVF